MQQRHEKATLCSHQLEERNNTIINVDSYEVTALIWALNEYMHSGEVCRMDLSSHSEKQILEGCISLIQEMVDGFREYLDYIGHDEPEYEEEKQPFHMSYFHIVNRLFLWHTHHSGGTSTRAKCHELGIDDSSRDVEFYLWSEEDEADD